MLLVCPNCSKKYKMTAEQLGDVGRNVECSSCHHVWFSTASDLVAPQDVKSQSPIAQTGPEKSFSSENPEKDTPSKAEAKPTKIDETRNMAPSFSEKENFTEKPEAENQAMPKPVAVQPSAAPKPQKTGLTPITPMAPQAITPQPVMPQPKASQPQNHIPQASNFNDDLKMFNEGAELFEKVEHSPFAAQPAETQPAKPAENKETAALEVEPKVEPQNISTKPQVEASKPLQSEVESEIKTAAPVKEDIQPKEDAAIAEKIAEKEVSTEKTPVDEKITTKASMEEEAKAEKTKAFAAAETVSSSPKIQAKKPFFTPENMGDISSHTDRSVAGKLPEPPKFTEEASPVKKETIERGHVTSETIVQNLPVIVKQDVNNELKDALIRSQQLNSRLSFMIFANMLLLTGILILLLLKS